MSRLCDCGGYDRVLPWTHQEYLSSHCMGVQARRILDAELEVVRRRLGTHYSAEEDGGNVVRFERDKLGAAG